MTGRIGGGGSKKEQTPKGENAEEHCDDVQYNLRVKVLQHTKTNCNYQLAY